MATANTKMKRTVLILIQLLFIVNIGNSNSCIIYQTPAQCNVHSLCTWDTLQSKCVCDSIIPQDVVIIMDSSGSVQAKGWIVLIEFVTELITTAIPLSSPIGIVQFATNAWIRYELTQDQNRTKILQTVSNLEYTRGWTYMKDAVTEALYLFENQSVHPQRKLVLITDGNPMPVSQTPCDLRPQLDDLGIDVLIIGVGASWTRDRIDCLVARDEDIIEVESFTPDAFEIYRNLTDEFLCRDVSFLLTEIKPSLGHASDPFNPFHPIPFVEFYNNVKDMDLSLYNFKIDGTFTGDMNYGSIVRSVYGNNWPYGTYLVVYDNSHASSNGDTVWCYDCVCDLVANHHLCNQSIYLSIPGSFDSVTSSVTNWNVIIYDATDIIQRQVMNVTYGMVTGTENWVVIDDGFTYELRDCFCDPTFGPCWKQSCTVYGTPGHAPIQCRNITCSDPNCQIGGDPEGVCNITTGLCDCNDGCYNIHNIPTCSCVVPPLNCSIILNTDVEGSGIPAGDASWSKPEMDWSNFYTVHYEVRWYTFQNDERMLKVQATPINQRALTLFNMEYRDPNVWKQEVRAIVDFGDDPNTPNITEAAVYNSEWTVCKLLTMTPTLSPTPAPTLGLPPIDRCNVTIRAGQNRAMSIDVQWTAADVSNSDHFGPDQFKNVYKLYFTQTDVYIPGTDNLAVRTYKVYNDTFYAQDLPYDYSAVQLVHNGTLEVKISVVVHAINATSHHLDIDPWFDGLMYAQATICEWFTHSPTPAPTHSPTIAPSDNPTLDPTVSPTLSPTYSWWVLDMCVIQVINNNNAGGNDLIISWDESNPSSDTTLPDYRRIYVYVNGTETRIFNQNQQSPQTLSNAFQIPIPVLTHSQIELVAQHLTNGNDATSLQFSPHNTTCLIVTLTPTLSPSNAPTTPEPTPTPIIRPTPFPTPMPTQSPTFNFPIEWCTVLIRGDTVYNLTFKVPQYRTDGTTPPINEVKYLITFAETSQILFASDVGNIWTYTDLLLTPNGVTIDYTTQFRMTTANSDATVTYAEYTDCAVQTVNPTQYPTISPTPLPTLSPTNPEVGVFVYSDDMTVCAGDERCACENEKYNYACIGSDWPEGTQIEDTFLRFLPSDGQQMTVLWLGRYPNRLQYDTIIYWEFVYLNDTQQFGYGQRIKPIRGRTQIDARAELGTVVKAEFVPMPNEENVYSPQWYKFKITECEVKTQSSEDENENENEMDESIDDEQSDHISCGAIYPSWAYVVWVPPSALEALLIGGADPWPDWIFYLLLAAAVIGVGGAYVLVVFMKNNNLKNNEQAQDQAAEAMLTGIAPGAHVSAIRNTDD